MSTDVVPTIGAAPVDLKATTVVASAEVLPDTPPAKDRLQTNESLTQGQSLTSTNGKYTFDLQGDGNVCINEVGGGCIWATGTTRHWEHVMRATMQPDGDLVMIGRGGDSVDFSTKTAGKGNASSVFILHDNGNAVIESDGKQIWQTNSARRTLPRKDFTNSNKNELYANEILDKGERLTSSNGEYYFVLDHGSSDLSLFKSSDSTLLWAQGYDAGVSPAKWLLRPDGNIALLTWSDDEKWSTATAGKGNHNALLRVQDDGNVVLLTEEGKVYWKTNTGSTLTDRLESGQTLGVGGKLASPNGKFIFELQQDRNIVLKEGDKILWASGSNTWIDVSLKMNAGGNLVLSSPKGMRADWQSGSGVRRSEEQIRQLRQERRQEMEEAQEQAEQTGDYRALERLMRSMNDRRRGRREDEEDEEITMEAEGDATLFVQDNGMACIRRSGLIIWSTRPNLGSTLPAGESIEPTQGLYSESPDNPYDNERFQFKYQTDGNLVLYDSRPNGRGDIRSLWNSGTAGSSPGRVTLEKDGRLVVYDAQNTVKWTSGAGQQGVSEPVVFQVQQDGNAVLKVGDKQVWATGTEWAIRNFEDEQERDREMDRRRDWDRRH